MTEDTLKNSESIYLAAGCFWGVEYYFGALEGVLETEVGYCGGHRENPTYRDVCRGDTGHAEVLRLRFDPNVISLASLLLHFLAMHDPTTKDRQGPDIGSQYRSAVFYQDPEQKQIIERVISAQPNSAEIVTEVTELPSFYPAETYHQQYVMKRQQ